jgi:hypothetical protein
MKKLLLGLALFVGIHTASASITHDQAYINFGMVNILTGGSQTQYVTITNTAATPMGPLEIESGCFLPDYTLQTTCPNILPANTNCDIYITFKPSHEGFFNCEIRIGSENAPGESDVNISGEGVN